MKNRLTETSFEVLYILHLIAKKKTLNPKEICEFLGFPISKLGEIIRYMIDNALLEKKSGNLLITNKSQRLIKVFDLVNLDVESDNIGGLNKAKIRRKRKKPFQPEDFYLPKDFVDDVKEEGRVS